MSIERKFGVGHVELHMYVHVCTVVMFCYSYAYRQNTCYKIMNVPRTMKPVCPVGLSACCVGEIKWDNSRCIGKFPFKQCLMTEVEPG